MPERVNPITFGNTEHLGNVRLHVANPYWIGPGYLVVPKFHFGKITAHDVYYDDPELFVFPFNEKPAPRGTAKILHLGPPPPKTNYKIGQEFYPLPEGLQIIVGLNQDSGYFNTFAFFVPRDQKGPENQTLREKIFEFFRSY